VRLNINKRKATGNKDMPILIGCFASGKKPYPDEIGLIITTNATISLRRLLIYNPVGVVVQPILLLVDGTDSTNLLTSITDNVDTTVVQFTASLEIHWVSQQIRTIVIYPNTNTSNTAPSLLAQCVLQMKLSGRTAPLGGLPTQGFRLMKNLLSRLFSLASGALASLYFRGTIFQ
jgi:hypothetical protein